MRKTYGAGLPFVVCALAPAQSTLSADQMIAVRLSRVFDGADERQPIKQSSSKKNRMATIGPVEVPLTMKLWI